MCFSLACCHNLNDPPRHSCSSIAVSGLTMKTQLLLLCTGSIQSQPVTANQHVLLRTEMMAQQLRACII